MRYEERMNLANRFCEEHKISKEKHADKLGLLLWRAYRRGQEDRQAEIAEMMRVLCAPYLES